MIPRGAPPSAPDRHGEARRAPQLLHDDCQRRRVSKHEAAAWASPFETPALSGLLTARGSMSSARPEHAKRSAVSNAGATMHLRDSCGASVHSARRATSYLHRCSPPPTRHSQAACTLALASSIDRHLRQPPARGHRPVLAWISTLRQRRACKSRSSLYSSDRVDAERTVCRPRVP